MIKVCEGGLITVVRYATGTETELFFDPGTLDLYIISEQEPDEKARGNLKRKLRIYLADHCMTDYVRDIRFFRTADWRTYETA